MVGTMQGLRKSCVLSPLFYNMFFAVALHVVLLCFSEHERIVQNLAHRDDDGAGRVEDPLVCEWRAVWATFYADAARVSPKSADGLASPCRRKTLNFCFSECSNTIVGNGRASGNP